MIQYKDWNLAMTTEELSVWGVKDGKQYPCIMKGKNNSSTAADYFICDIQNATVKFNHLTIKYGQMTLQLWNPPLCDQFLLILHLLLVPCVPAGKSAVILLNRLISNRFKHVFHVTYIVALRFMFKLSVCSQCDANSD
ncbi:hypothetical protein ILYODFUR_035502 [Ilyodon furcidens]|uniref:Uncharacterized protein n=1 Tax=Ilyodon furcidens TaxID=33524 RepID=A0ABV0TE52_9TELE